MAATSASVSPVFLPTAELISIQNWQPTRAAVLSPTSDLSRWGTWRLRSRNMLIREEAHTSAGTRACTFSGVSSFPKRRLAAPYIQRMLHFASWRSNGLILGMKISWRKHVLFGLYREEV